MNVKAGHICVVSQIFHLCNLVVVALDPMIRAEQQNCLYQTTVVRFLDRYIIHLMSIELRCWASNFTERQRSFSNIETKPNSGVMNMLSGRLFVYMSKHDFHFCIASLRSKNVRWLIDFLCAMFIGRYHQRLNIHFVLCTSFSSPHFPFDSLHFVLLFQLLRIFGECLKQKSM